MDKKTILVFIDWYVPGYKAGGPIKSIYSMVRYLKKDINFRIITSNTDLNEPEPYPSIESDRWNETEDGVSVFYASKQQLNKENIQSFLTTIQYDAVYVNGLFSLYFSVYPLWFKKSGVITRPLILAPRGMLGEGALKLKWRKKKLFLVFFKLIKAHERITWHATSEQEKQECYKIFGTGIKVVTVPNLQYTESTVLNPVPEKKKGTVKLLFLSRVSEKKNLHFALEVLMRTSLKPEQQVSFDIYGPIENQEYWQQCLALIHKLREKGYQIEYKGAVKSELVSAVIEQYHFLFLPTLNENYGHAIVESFVVGRPVIISDQTPWIQLENQNAGWDIRLDNSAKFESVIQKCLLMPDDVYQKMVIDSKQYAQQFCNSESNAVLMKLMFENILANA